MLLWNWVVQYLSCCPVFQPAEVEDSRPLVQDMEGIPLHLLVEDRGDTLGHQLPVLLHNPVEGGMQVGNHQPQEDMLGDNLPLVAEEDTQDNPVVVQALGIPDQAAWDRAGLLAAWALHRQEVVH